MSRQITARDYLPRHAVQRIDRRNEAARQRRIEAFLPRLDAHHCVHTAETITGVLELRGTVKLAGSSERWVRGVIYTRNQHGAVSSTEVIIPRVTTCIGSRRIVSGQCLPRPVVVDISAPDVQWVDSRTGYTVHSDVPVVLRRHA